MAWGEGVDPLLHDFRNFLFLVWKHLNLPDPTPVQYDIAETIQNGPMRMVIEAFRGVGKSWITSAFVCWVLLMDPQMKILVVSASKVRADDFSTFTKRLINEMPVLAHLKPRDGQRDSTVSFDVGPAMASHAPSVKSLGITSQLAGSRADVIIADDVEVQNNSLTQLMREKLGESVKEFDAILTPKPTSRIIYLGTPQTEESIYNQLELRGYQIFCWPARFPKDPKSLESYGVRLAPYLRKQIDSSPVSGAPRALWWTPTDPKRFGEGDLLAREASYGRSGFALQFMLDTSLSDANRYPLKLSDLIIMPLDGDKAPVKVAWGSSPELTIQDLQNVGFTGDRYFRPFYVDKDWAEYQGSVMVIDPAGTGGDELAYCVVKCLHGMLFLTACGGLKGGYVMENLEHLARTARDHKVNYILTERNFGDGMFDQLLKPVLARIYPCTIDPDGIRNTVQKERRIIDTLEPVMNQHRLIVDRRIIEEDLKEPNRDHQLFYQMTRLTKERGALRHDDRIDVVAMAVGYWLEAMARDVNRAVADRTESLIENELRAFQEHVFGMEQRQDVWVHHMDHLEEWAG